MSGSKKREKNDTILAFFSYLDIRIEAPLFHFFNHLFPKWKGAGKRGDLK